MDGVDGVDDGDERRANEELAIVGDRRACGVRNRDLLWASVLCCRDFLRLCYSPPSTRAILPKCSLYELCENRIHRDGLLHHDLASLPCLPFPASLAHHTRHPPLLHETTPCLLTWLVALPIWQNQRKNS